MADDHSQNPPNPAAPGVPPATPDSKSKKTPVQPSRKFAAFAVLILSVGMFIAAWCAPAGWNWLVVAACLALFLMFISLAVTGRPAGMFINERNLMSLSRFQMAIWTVVILSGFFTMAMLRLRSGNERALDIGMDWQLWALMGISTASLVGSPLVLNQKKDQTPDKQVVERTAAATQETTKEVNENRVGVLYANADLKDASLADMFQGDEVQNTAYLDLAKVQMFIFTLIAAVTYGVALWDTFHRAAGAPGGLEYLPSLSSGMVALLGISHAGYLSSKGVGHTKTV